jgi:hypothetical protein
LRQGKKPSKKTRDNYKKRQLGNQTAPRFKPRLVTRTEPKQHPKSKPKIRLSAQSRNHSSHSNLDNNKFNTNHHHHVHDPPTTTAPLHPRKGMIKPRPYKVQQQGNYRRQPRPMYQPNAVSTTLSTTNALPTTSTISTTTTLPIPSSPTNDAPQCHTTPNGIQQQTINNNNNHNNFNCPTTTEKL